MERLVGVWEKGSDWEVRWRRRVMERSEVSRRVMMGGEVEKEAK